MICGYYAEEKVVSRDLGKRMRKLEKLLKRWGGMGRRRGLWRGLIDD